jgi:cytochrome c biogenesis protein CcmG, thiol:disulfide interchange protein DsbE
MGAAGMTARPARGGAGRLQTIAVIGVTAIVIGALAWVISGPGTDDGVTAVNLTGDVAGAAPAVGAVPPGFTAKTWDGTTVSLADYAGKPVWLTFGASWCPDCRTEAPDVEATYQAYRDRGLVVLAVFIDESSADVGAYAQRAGLTFPIAVDQSEAIASSYRTLGIPTHFFIGADGRIKDIRIGALPRSEMDSAVASIVQ